MAGFKAVTLYKGDCEYLCETEERLERFLAAGWKKTKPKGKKSPSEGKDPADGAEGTAKAPAGQEGAKEGSGEVSKE